MKNLCSQGGIGGEGINFGFVIDLKDEVVDVCALIALSTANIKKMNNIGESNWRRIDLLLRHDNSMFFFNRDLYCCVIRDKVLLIVDDFLSLSLSLLLCVWVTASV